MGESILRRMILLYVLVSVAAMVAGFYAPIGHEQVTSAPWHQRYPGAAVALLLPLLLADLAGIVGLFWFRPWGRTLALLTTLARMCIDPWSSVAATTWAHALLYDVSTLLWGAALALAYFSAESARFRPRA